MPKRLLSLLGIACFLHLLPAQSPATARDTIAILKDGLAAYEQLFEEQGDFIDTLLVQLGDAQAQLHATDSATQPRTRDSLRMLAARVDRLMALNDSLRKLPPQSDPVDSTLLYAYLDLQRAFTRRDSIYRLREAEWAAFAQHAAWKDIQHRLRIVERQVIQQAARTRQLEEEVQHRTQQTTQLQIALNRKQSLLAQTRGQAENRTDRQREELEELSRSRDLLRDRIEMLLEERDRLRYVLEGQNAQLRETEQALQHLQTLQQALRRGYDSLKNEFTIVAQREAALRAFGKNWESERDSLDQVIQAQQSLIFALNGRRDSLETQLSTLDPYSQSARRARRIFLEQLDYLESLQRSLPTRERELVRREKLVAQRERVLRAAQAEELGPLLDQLNALADENARLNAELEAARTDTVTVRTHYSSMYSGTLLWQGASAPAFCFDTREGRLSLQTRIQRYFEARGVPHFPESPLTFSQISLSDIAQTPLRVHFHIGAELANGNRRIACVFQRGNGSYVTPTEDEATRRAVDAFLAEVFN